MKQRFGSEGSLFVFLIVLAMQFVLVSWTFPVTELFTDTPLFHIDAAFHWYQMKFAANIASTGALVGYDPFFNAGYPGGVTYNWSAKLPAALSAVLTPGLSEIQIYKMVSFISAVLGPPCVALAANWLHVGRRAAIIASVFGLMLWWASYFRWYHTAGMVTFVMASYFALPYSVLMIRYLRQEVGFILLLIIGLVGAAATFYHPFFPFPVATVVVAYLMVFWRDIPRYRLLALLTIVPLLSALPNLAWLLPMSHFHHVFSTGVENLSPYQKIVDANLIWKEMIGVFQDHYHGAKIYLALVIASVWACFREIDDNLRHIAWVFVFSAAALIIFAALGAAIPGVGQVQPNRFSTVGYLLLALPAALGMSSMLECARGAWKTWSARVAIGALIFMVTSSAYSLNEVRREVSYGNVGHYGKRPPEVDGVGDYSQWLLSWLQQNTTRAGRVLFESSKGRVHDDAVMAGYYAYTSDREFIGGPYPFMHFAGFWDGFVFGKPIQNIEKARFAEYIDLYNVGWIVAHSEVTKRYLENIPWVVPVDDYKQLRVYRLDRSLGFFVSGCGEIQDRGHNRLTVSELAGEEVVLKYHFVPGMVSTPPATLEPVWIMDDPNPFIKISHPPKRLTISLPGIIADSGGTLPR